MRLTRSPRVRACWQGCVVTGNLKICSACGHRVAAGAACANAWCSAPDRPLSAVFWAGRYEGALRRAVLAYKYRADLRWAKIFGRLLHAFLRGHATWFEEFSVACPVPSYAGPRARRGWGHVELLCAELASLSAGEWPVEHLVHKVAETQPMSATARPERYRIAARHLAKSLAPVPGACIEGRRVLLVDDVCASGQTLLTVARALRSAGASEVSGLVLARASFRSGAPGPGVSLGPDLASPNLAI
jgi:predicted amidophosphoribosyltransferase